MCHLCDLETEMDKACAKAVHPAAGRTQINNARIATKAYAAALSEQAQKLGELQANVMDALREFIIASLIDQEK